MSPHALEQHFDPRTKSYYYRNRRDGSTQWEKPGRPHLSATGSLSCLLLVTPSPSEACDNRAPPTPCRRSRPEPPPGERYWLRSREGVDARFGPDCFSSPCVPVGHAIAPLTRACTRQPPGCSENPAPFQKNAHPHKTRRGQRWLPLTACAISDRLQMLLHHTWLHVQVYGRVYERVHDPYTGHCYYFNKITQEVPWVTLGWRAVSTSLRMHNSNPYCIREH